MHGPPQVLADDRIRVADAGERPPDCLADGDTGALTIVGERARPAANPAALASCAVIQSYSVRARAARRARRAGSSADSS